MKTIKTIILITWAFVVANLLSCTFTHNPDGSYSGGVDPAAVVTITTKIIEDK